MGDMFSDEMLKFAEKQIESELRSPLVHLNWVSNQLAIGAALEADRAVARYLRFAWTEPAGYWEAELARQIKYRSIRSRLRRIPKRIRYAAQGYRGRIDLAYEALRGRHDCGDY